MNQSNLFPSSPQPKPSTEPPAGPSGQGPVCYWENCMLQYADHRALGTHLSEDHVGWKRGEYRCEWADCIRQGVKCHNRFALMMHLRIHTGEKPFECTFANCGQSFGRQDALMRHRKAEHGEEHLDGAPSGPAVKSGSNLNKKPLNLPLSKAPKGFEGDTPPKKRKQISGDFGTSEDTPSSREYTLAKAKLQYIVRENEMLNDELMIAQKKLRRLETERRVLLDVLMSTDGDREEMSSL
ncbi:C2H2-type zinc finger transcription factor [Phycomyces blakesleeanus]